MEFRGYVYVNDWELLAEQVRFRGTWQELKTKTLELYNMLPVEVRQMRSWSATCFVLNGGTGGHIHPDFAEHVPECLRYHTALWQAFLLLITKTDYSWREKME